MPTSGDMELHNDLRMNIINSVYKVNELLRDDKLGEQYQKRVICLVFRFNCG
jgi:hypothetical protein